MILHLITGLIVAHLSGAYQVPKEHKYQNYPVVNSSATVILQNANSIYIQYGTPVEYDPQMALKLQGN